MTAKKEPYAWDRTTSIMAGIFWYGNALVVIGGVIASWFSDYEPASDDYILLSFIGVMVYELMPRKSRS